MRLLRVGQNASFVDAINALYLEPTLDPDRTTPPGKGVIIFASFLIGKLAERGWDRKSKVILSMLLGNIIIYVFGLPWLMINLSASLENTLLWGLWPFIPGDAVKLVLASLALPGAWALVDKIKN